MRIRVQAIASRRSGTTPFWAVWFDDERGSERLAVGFEEPGHVAVPGVVFLADPGKGVRFGVNSWRGDQYEPALRRARGEHESAEHWTP